MVCHVRPLRAQLPRRVKGRLRTARSPSAIEVTMKAFMGVLLTTLYVLYPPAPRDPYILLTPGFGDTCSLMSHDEGPCWRHAAEVRPSPHVVCSGPHVFRSQSWIADYNNMENSSSFGLNKTHLCCCHECYYKDRPCVSNS